MCGIASIVGKTKQDIVQLKSLLLPIKHRGELQYFNESADLGRCVLGMNRLAIVDRKRAKQPMRTKDGRYSIVFNGEIYNYKKLQSELKDLGYVFVTDADTEVLVHGYAAWQEKLLDKIVGMYAFFIYDTETGDFFAARDLIGIKPLYWAKDENETYYFASEIKSLAPVEAIENIELFPPAHYMKNGDLIRYWNIPTAIDRNISEKEAKKTIRQLFDQAVKRRVQSDLPVAVYLSGGIDSTAVLATARKYHSDVTAIIIGNDESSDRAIAVRYCEENGIRYIAEAPPSEEDLALTIPKAVRMAESFEPNMIKNVPLSFVIATIAAKHSFKIILCGEGADEVFAGYPEFSVLENAVAVEKKIVTFLLDLHRTQLQRVDRTSMAVTTEVRVPFLDKDLLEYALKLSGDLKIRHENSESITKYIFRKAMTDRLPEYIYNRKKMVLSEGAGYKGNQPIGGLFYDIVVKNISDEELEKYVTDYPEWHLRTKEEVYYFKLYRDYGYLKAVFNQKRTMVNKISTASDEGLAESIFSVFCSGKFRREHPNKDIFLPVIQESIRQNKPLEFVMYWGKGNRHQVGDSEREALQFLNEFFVEIKKVYSLGIRLAIIFTDTHARLNGYNDDDIRENFLSLTNEVKNFGYEVSMMSSLIDFDQEALLQQVPMLSLDDPLLTTLKGSAEKHSKAIKDSEIAAKLYYLQNQKEKVLVEKKFPLYIFLTYNRQELDNLLSSSLPILHIHPYKRGVNVKPWFA